MFKDRYKKANDSITDEALKQKILNPQPAKIRSFVPAYSYGTICAGAIALILLFSNQAKDTKTPQVAEVMPAKYEYEYTGEQFLKADTANMPKVRMAENINSAVADASYADAVYEDISLCKTNTNQKTAEYTYKTSLTPSLKNIGIDFALIIND